MAKKAYVGVNNVARKTKQIYVGVNGVARKVKKGYIGVNGVAKLFFGNLSLIKYGVLNGNSNTTNVNRGASLPNYALFIETSYSTNAIVTYNSSLTSGKQNILQYSTNKTIFNNDTHAFVVDSTQFYKIDSSFTKTVSSYVANYSIRSDACGVANESYAITTGWNNSSSTGYVYTISYTVDTLTGSLMSPSSSPSITNQGGGSSCPYYDATSGVIGNYMIFAGGEANYQTTSASGGTVYAYSGGQSVTDVNAYNSSLTRTKPTGLEGRAEKLASASNKNMMLIGGGWAYLAYQTYNTSSGGSWSQSRTYINSVNDFMNMYNTSLTRTLMSGNSLSTARCDLSGINLGDYFIFSGGDTSTPTAYSSNPVVTTDIYDTSLTHRHDSSTDLVNTRINAGAATVGTYGIICGGGSNIPEVYAIN